MTSRRFPVVGMTWSIAWLAAASVLTAAGPGAAAWGQNPDPKSGAPGDPTAESVLRKTAEFFKNAKSIAVDVDRSRKMGRMTMEITTSIAFQRPNRLAVRHKGTTPGIDLVTDGKTMFISVAAVKKYTEAEAPATIDAAPMGDPIAASAMQFMMIGELCSADPYAKLMDGVTTATYVGQETIEGAKTHHLKFAQDQLDWEMWVDADGDPTVRRVVVDLTKSVANSPLAEQFKNQKMEMIQNFKGWQTDRGIDEKSFAFQPPAGAQKVKSFMEGRGAGAQDASERRPRP